MLRVVVTDVVCAVPHEELTVTTVTQDAAVAELRGWVTVVVVTAAAVVVGGGGGVTTEGAGGTVFITVLTLPDWLDITILD